MDTLISSNDSCGSLEDEVMMYSSKLQRCLIDEQKENYLDNKTGLEYKLKEFSLCNLQWLDRLDVTEPASLVYSANLDNDSIVMDDNKMELKFYRQSQTSVLEALAVLSKLSYPTKRPDDFFAEMAKSDEHMQKVRTKLLEKKTYIERSERVKKLREMRKYGKKVQQEKLQKKHTEKKEMLSLVKKFRKGKIDKLNLFEEIIERHSLQKKQQFKPNKRREFKNKKFGFGGQKKRSKYNSADSSADMKEFNANITHGKGQQNAKGKRPRKNKRKF